LKAKAPGTVVSYAELLRQALQPPKEDISTDADADTDADAPPDPENSSERVPRLPKEEGFFQALLARSAKYTLHDDDDEDSSGVSCQLFS
jgi:hypothetical protein